MADFDYEEDEVEIDPTLRPWERQEGESVSAFRAFTIWRSLPPDERTPNIVHSIYAKTDKTESPLPLGSITSWKTVNKWIVRAKAFDRHLDASAVEGMAKATLQVAKKTHTSVMNRRKRVNERRYRDGMRAVKKGEAFLDHPTDEVTIQDGGNTTIIKGVRADTHLAGMKLIKIGFELLAEHFAENETILYGSLDLPMDEIPTPELSRLEDYRILTAIIYKLKTKVPNGDIEDIRRLLDAVAQRAKLLGHDVPKAERDGDEDNASKPPAMIEISLSHAPSPVPIMAEMEAEEMI